MQPYFFPYLGYFQLAAAADTLVFFDDVQYIRRGYINRNSVLLNGKKLPFSIPVKKAPREHSILEVELHQREYPRWRQKWLAQLKSAYAKTPCYQSVCELVESVTDLMPDGETADSPPGIAELAEASVTSTLDYLGIGTQTLRSSDLDYDRDGDGQAKVLSIASQLTADTYLNPPGGRELYDVRAFTEANLELAFLQPVLEPYDQGTGEFTGSLSILDLMFRFPPEEIRALCASGQVQAAGAPTT